MNLFKSLKLIIIINLLIITVDGNDTRPYQFRDVGVDNKIGMFFENEIKVYDDYLNEINLIELLSMKPTIINFVYLNCPMLCHLLLDGLVDVIKRSNYSITDDYQIVTISIDPDEELKLLRDYRKKYLKEISKNDSWFFLKGNKTTIEQITSKLGYSYKYIDRTNDFSHPAVLFFYHPEKGLTNYLEGVSFEEDVFDYSIMNIKEKKSIEEKIITFCYFYDPDTQTYTLYIFNIMRIACIATVAIIILMIIKIILKERRLGLKDYNE